MADRATILCAGCTVRALDNTDEVIIRAAWVPVTSLDLTDMNILVCPPWPPLNPLPGVEPAFCEGCGLQVALAPSSRWLLDGR